MDNIPEEPSTTAAKAKLQNLTQLAVDLSSNKVCDSGCAALGSELVPCPGCEVSSRGLAIGLSDVQCTLRQPGSLPLSLKPSTTAAKAKLKSLTQLAVSLWKSKICDGGCGSLGSELAPGP